MHACGNKAWSYFKISLLYLTTDSTDIDVDVFYAISPLKPILNIGFLYVYMANVYRKCSVLSIIDQKLLCIWRESETRLYTGIHAYGMSDILMLLIDVSQCDAKNP